MVDAISAIKWGVRNFFDLTTQLMHLSAQWFKIIHTIVMNLNVT